MNQLLSAIRGGTTKRVIAVLLCVLFFLCVVAGYAAMALHDDHDCHGEQCEICVTLDHVRNLLKQIQGAGVAVMAVCFYAAAGFICLSGCLDRLPSSTPVMLRVRMDQ